MTQVLTKGLKKVGEEKTQPKKYIEIEGLYEGAKEENRPRHHSSSVRCLCSPFSESADHHQTLADDRSQSLAVAIQPADRAFLPFAHSLPFSFSLFWASLSNKNRA